MDLIKIDDSNILHFRPTPWDAKLIGKPSNEILKIIYTDGEKLNSLFQKFESYCLKNDVKYTVCRVVANDKIARKYLHNNGYYFAESSLEVTKINVQKSDFAGKMRLPVLSPMKAVHLPQIKKIAIEDFHHGRMIEDPFLDEKKGRKRSENWIDDLWNQQNDKFVWERGGQVIAFTFQKVFNEEGRAQVILAGVRGQESMLAPIFWATFLDKIKQCKVERIENIISASNLGVLNLYIHFQFKVTQTFFGFHKLR